MKQLLRWLSCLCAAAVIVLLTLPLIHGHGWIYAHILWWLPLQMTLAGLCGELWFRGEDMRAAAVEQG